MAEKSLDRVRIYATKKNVRAVCEALAGGCSIPEACESIGITTKQWHDWRRRKPDVAAQHQAAMAAKAELLEDEILYLHDDLTDAQATNARVKLRDSKVQNRLAWLKGNVPLKWSDKQIVGHQDLNPATQAAAEDSSAGIMARFLAKAQAAFPAGQPVPDIAPDPYAEGLDAPVTRQPARPLRLSAEAGEDAMESDSPVVIAQRAVKYTSFSEHEQPPDCPDLKQSEREREKRKALLKWFDENDDAEDAQWS